MQVIVLNQNKELVEKIENELILIDDTIKISKYYTLADFYYDFNSFNRNQIYIIDLKIDDESGIEIAKKINKEFNGAQIIYVTGQLEFDSNIFETDVCYYINANEIEKFLHKALKKAINKIMNSETILIIKKQMKSISININDIIFIERKSRQTVLHLADTSFSTYDNFDQLVAKLPENFFKCHYSFVINFNYLLEYKRNGFVLKDGTSIPISRSYEKSAKIAYFNYLRYRE